LDKKLDELLGPGGPKKTKAGDAMEEYLLKQKRQKPERQQP
jgi:hypothetical protein